MNTGVDDQMLDKIQITMELIEQFKENYGKERQTDREESKSRKKIDK